MKHFFPGNDLITAIAEINLKEWRIFDVSLIFCKTLDISRKGVG